MTVVHPSPSPWYCACVRRGHNGHFGTILWTESMATATPAARLLAWVHVLMGASIGGPFWRVGGRGLLALGGVTHVLPQGKNAAFGGCYRASLVALSCLDT